MTGQDQTTDGDALLVPFHDPGPLPVDEVVPVFHGTAGRLRGLVDRDGLHPSPARDHVFVTRTYERAVDYARARAAQETADPASPAAGLIVHALVPAERLEEDPFNRHAEPDQWIVRGAIERSLITKLEERLFPELADPQALDFNQAYARSLAEDDWEAGHPS